jgi:hypothetical protein
MPDEIREQQDPIFDTYNRLDRVFVANQKQDVLLCDFTRTSIGYISSGLDL